MDAQLKAKWVEALRSGEYRQTYGRLFDAVTGGYCCLGVLCKVAGLSIDPCHGNGVSGAGSFGYAPIFALVGGHDASHELSMRNDGFDTFHKHSFSEIADYIEANY